MQPPLPEIQSLWRDTADPGPDFAPLSGDAQCDVVVIGGGYTGMSAARQLARQGMEPLVLEASRVGWGASGRNGGVVSGKYRVGLRDIAEGWDIQTARRMADLGHEAVDLVGELVDAYGIASARLLFNGNLRCAHNEAALAALREERDWLASQMGDTSSRMLSREEVAAETGSRDFVGGLLQPHAGQIHPLNYARGLASGLAREGLRIHDQSPATGLRREGEGVIVETPSGQVRARRAIVATNGYSDLTRASDPVQRTLIPFRSAMIATQPLDAGLRGQLLRDNRTYSETRRMMRWFRLVGDRLLFGGRGAFGKHDSPSAFAALQRAMVGIFPQLAGTAITHQWSGLVAMTLDSVPHVGRLDDRVSYAVGYNGAGVAMSTLMGRYVAGIALGESPDIGLMWSPRFKRVPFYSIREPAVRLVAGWYQFLDAIGR